MTQLLECEASEIRRIWRSIQPIANTVAFMQIGTAADGPTYVFAALCSKHTYGDALAPIEVAAIIGSDAPC